jgi:hypothetical protein
MARFSVRGALALDSLYDLVCRQDYLEANGGNPNEYIEADPNVLRFAHINLSCSTT